MGEVRYTDEQRACVERLVGPVDISAGAGSGKTFTLTQRIAYALAQPGSGVDDIDQVCAITFTNKAAAELKGRVRSTLRAQGLFDQALEVDSAWISTIHGMCSRILRASALQLGIDPGFRVLSEKERATMAAEAISEVLGRDSDIVAGDRHDQLFREFPVRSVFREQSVTSLLEDLLRAASSMPEGFDGFVRAGSLPAPSSLAKELLLAYEEVAPAYEALAPSASRETALRQIDEARGALEEFVLSGSQDAAGLAAVLDRCPLLAKSRAKAASEACAAYQEAHSRIAQNAALLRGAALLDDALDLARRVEGVLAEKKRRAGALDNDDLVKLTLRALSDPSIAAQYENRFRLVMVDEFQDTDAQQIAIVKHLAGPGMRYLCTVGDAQQSIYRFRGADVAGYRAFRASLDDPAVRAAGGEPKKLLLSRNFRSHADVLSFVKRICAQPRAFGEGFLDLEAAYDGARYRGPAPRIRLIAAVAPPDKQGGGKGADLADAQARAAVSYFREMREAGHELSDMVLLLGRMKNAEGYARAIRDAGFPCVIAGGSTFFQAPEVAVVGDLLRAIANAEDTAALFAVMTSDMMQLSADDLLALATGENEAWGVPESRKLHRGLAAFRRALPAEASPALRHAVRLLARAHDEVRCEPPSKVLLDTLTGSGWIERLERRGAEGAAVIANILKAVRYVERIEGEGCRGAASAAAEFSEILALGVKDAPGALNAEGQQAVRILTIHASKGLEFPIVALADFEGSSGSSGKLAMQSVGGRAYASLMPGRATLREGGALAKAAAKVPAAPDGGDGLGAGDLLAAPDPAAFHGMLLAIGEAEERAEAQRLFYVGATRAKESLAVIMGVKQRVGDPASSYRGLVDDIRAAFFGTEGFPDGDAALDFGGSEDALLRVIPVMASSDGDAAPAEDGGGGGAERERDEPIGWMEVPEVEPYRPLRFSAMPQRRSGLFSYSSLARALGASEAAPGSEAACPPDDAEAAADADKATAFGSAFHRLAQVDALAGPEAARAQVPSAARALGVRDEGRLSAALERWLASGVRRRARSHARFVPELPFAVRLGDEALEGEMDLFCAEGFSSRGAAFVVDYKTGGSDAEGAEALERKHALQARCYAYAVLCQGFDEVELVFARVEQDDPAGGDALQAVRYRFARSQLGQLERDLSSLRARALGGSCPPPSQP